MADQQQPAAEKEASPRQPAAAATSLLASFRANTAHDRGDNNVPIAEASGLPADPLSAADSAVASDAGAPAPHAGSPPLAPASFQPPPPPPPSPAAHAASPVAAGAAAAAAAIAEEEAANLAAINAVREKMLKQLKENRLEYVAALGRRDEGKATAADHAIIASTAKMETSLAANKAVVDANAAINAAGGAAASHAAAAAAKAKSLVQLPVWNYHIMVSVCHIHAELFQPFLLFLLSTLLPSLALLLLKLKSVKMLLALLKLCWRK